MALFAVYRVIDGDDQLQVYFSDIRRERCVEHLCMLPDRLSLIREITDQLTAMGFALEHHDSSASNLVTGELRIFSSHIIPEGAGSSADAIRTVCSRHAIEPTIITGEGNALRPS